MNILRIAEALHFARPFYFKSLDSSADPVRTKKRSGQSELAAAWWKVLVGIIRIGRLASKKGFHQQS
jgi:hypothetical protein